MHTQRDHAEFLITDKAAHHVLIVKDNQPGLLRQLRELPWPQISEQARTRDPGHGRVEIRPLKVATVPNLGFPHAARAIRLQRRTRDLASNHWPTTTVYAVTSPLAPDQGAVPAQQRLGREEQRCPPLPGEHPAGGSEQDPVACGEPGAAGLAAQHPKLLPQHQDLQVFGGVIGIGEDQQAGQQADGQPEQEKHRRMVRKRLLTTRTRVSAPHMLREAGVFGQEPWIERLVDGHGGSTRTASRSPWMSVDAVGDRVRRASPGEAVGQDCDLQRLRAVAG
jgi:hypothetical protein